MFENYQKLTWIGIFLLFVNICYAQDTVYGSIKQNAFFITIGYGNLSLLDRHASAMQYQSHAIEVDFGYCWSNKKRTWSISLPFQLGRFYPKKNKTRKIYFDNGFEDEVSNPLWILPGIKINYLKSIQSQNGNSVHHLGGNFTFQVSPPIGIDDIFLHVFSVASLRPVYKLETTIFDKHKVSLHTQVALLSVVTRMPFDNEVESGVGESMAIGFYKSGTALALPNRFQHVNLQFGYQLPFEKTSLELIYGIDWMHDNYPNHLTRLSNSLMLKTNF